MEIIWPENCQEMSWKCSEKYRKAYIFFIFQWIEFKFENVKYISIYLTNILKKWNFQVKLFPPKKIVFLYIF